MKEAPLPRCKSGIDSDHIRYSCHEARTIPENFVRGSAGIVSNVCEGGACHHECQVLGAVPCRTASAGPWALGALSADSRLVSHAELCRLPRICLGAG